MRRNFSESSEVQTFFPLKNRWSPKKKKEKRSSPNLSLIFWPKSEIQTIFQPKNRWSPKKKKKRSSPKLSLIFRPRSEIQTIFQPKNRWSPKKKKKKKKVFTKIESDFSAKIGNSNDFSHRITTSASRLRHSISFGGAVFNFSPKIGLKSNKNVQFCILHKPMGGLQPPSPPPRLCYWLLNVIDFG